MARCHVPALVKEDVPSDSLNLSRRIEDSLLNATPLTSYSNS